MKRKLAQKIALHAGDDLISGTLRPLSAIYGTEKISGRDVEEKVRKLQKEHALRGAKLISWKKESPGIYQLFFENEQTTFKVGLLLLRNQMSRPRIVDVTLRSFPKNN